MSYHYWWLNKPFCCSKDFQCFSMSRTTRKIAPYSGRISISHLIHGSLGPRESVPKRHLDRFSCFDRAHGRDQQTDRHTDRPRYTVCSNTPHLGLIILTGHCSCPGEAVTVSVYVSVCLRTISFELNDILLAHVEAILGRIVIFLFFYLFISIRILCYNSVRMSHRNKRLLTYILLRIVCYDFNLSNVSSYCRWLRVSSRWRVRHLAYPPSGVLFTISS